MNPSVQLKTVTVTKLAAVVLALLVLLLADPSNLRHLLFSLLAVLLLPICIQTRFKTLIRRLFKLLPFLLLAGVISLALLSGQTGALYPHFIWRPSAVLYPLLCLLYAGPPEELLAGIGRFPIPGALLAIPALTLYHLRRLRHTWQQARLAFRARTFALKPVQRIRLAGNLTTTLLQKMLATTEITEMALSACGFTGRLYYQQPQQAGIWDGIVILIFSTLLGGVLWI